MASKAPVKGARAPTKAETMKNKVEEERKAKADILRAQMKEKEEKAAAAREQHKADVKTQAKTSRAGPKAAAAGDAGTKTSVARPTSARPAVKATVGKSTLPAKKAATPSATSRPVAKAAVVAAPKEASEPEDEPEVSEEHAAEHAEGAAENTEEAAGEDNDGENQHTQEVEANEQHEEPSAAHDDEGSGANAEDSATAVEVEGSARAESPLPPPPAWESTPEESAPEAAAGSTASVDTEDWVEAAKRAEDARVAAEKQAEEDAIEAEQRKVAESAAAKLAEEEALFMAEAAAEKARSDRVKQEAQERRDREAAEREARRKEAEESALAQVGSDNEEQRQKKEEEEEQKKAREERKKRVAAMMAKAKGGTASPRDPDDQTMELPEGPTEESPTDFLLPAPATFGASEEPSSTTAEFSDAPVEAAPAGLAGGEEVQGHGRNPFANDELNEDDGQETFDAPNPFLFSSATLPEVAAETVVQNSVEDGLWQRVETLYAGRNDSTELREAENTIWDRILAGGAASVEAY